MRNNNHIVLLLILLTFVPLLIKPNYSVGESTGRRILHQPFFPTATSPPPDYQLPLPPLPPPVDTSTPDQPFFPEIPTGETQNLLPPPPPQAAAANGVNPTIPIAAAAAQSTKPAKKVAIAVSVGIVTLGMLSALAFFIYRHKVKETRKFDGGNSQRLQNDTREPPSFLYLGTVEPTGTSSANNGTPTMNEANGSTYGKLSTDIKRSDRYRPSPELQPLPQLVKPSAPARSLDKFSPSASALYLSSDEESAFYTTPKLCSVTKEDVCNYMPLTSSPKVNSVPHSKRTSPRSSRFSVASPEMKHVILPSTKEQLPPLPPPRTAARCDGSPEIIYAYPPQRPKFSAPPPPPNMALLRSLNSPTRNSRIPTPPPPPPPVPPQMVAAMSTPKKVRPLETNNFSNPATPVIIKPQTWTPSPKSSSPSVGPSSSETYDRDEVDGGKPRLKPLHWDKVRATSDRATVWDQLKSSSFQLNEDRMETLFGYNSTNSVQKEGIRKSVMPSVEQGNRVLDPKKSQNIAILLRALNVTRDEVSEALLDGNPESLDAELLETLVKMAPTKEEEIKLREYKGDVSKLGSAERFLKTVLDVPFAFKRVEAMLYRANFDTEVKYLRKSFHTLEAASEELRSSRLFLKLLEAVLQTGNRMNVGTNRGAARSFKLDTLLKLVDIKGTDGKTTLLHFVVQEIIRSEGAGHEFANDKTQSNMNEDDFRKRGLRIVSGLSKDLSNVKKAAGMDSDVLSSYITKLEMGLQKVKVVLQYEKQEGKFFNSMKTFLIESEEEIAGIKAYEKTALVLVREVTEYFHGDSMKEEAHPLRIFLIVRDFLSGLDQVCKEVGIMQERTMVGSSRSFRISASASLPVLNRYNVRQDSSDDESLSP